MTRHRKTGVGRIQVLVGLVLLLGAGIGVAAQEEPSSFDNDYADGTYGRVTYEENGPRILHDPSTEVPRLEERARLNLPIFPGDTVVTESDQRLEIELTDGSFLWVDRSSRVTFVSLPDPYAEVPDNAVVQLAEGALRVEPRVEASDAEFRVDTPAAAVYLLSDGDFRIETSSSGRTRLWARRGVAEVSAEGGSVLVRGGFRTTVYPGELPEDPRGFNTMISDGFDRWVDGRKQAWARRESRDYVDDDEEVYDEIPEEVRPYYRELRIYGRWVYVAPYGYCWYPFDVGPGWRPYVDGYWSFGPWGYFWVANEPWGWAPYRFGRWVWAGGYGWCWVPGRVFGGAWVAWHWSTGFVGWAPLDYWNRPAFVTRVRYGYYDPHAWTFVHVTHLDRHDYRRYRVSVDHAGPALRGGAVVTRPPRVPPDRLARDPEARRRALEELRGRRTAALPPVADGERRSRPFRELERRALPRLRDLRRAADARPGAAPPRQGDPPSRPGARPAPPRRLPPALTDRGERVDPTRREAPALGRRGDRQGVPVDPRSGEARRRPPRRDTAPPASPGDARRREDAPAKREVAPPRREVAPRLRDYYRRKSEPTVRRTPSPSTRKEARPAHRPAPRRTEARSGPSRRAPERARPSSPRRSHERARPSRESSGRGSSSARPARGSGGKGKPSRPSRPSRKNDR